MRISDWSSDVCSSDLSSPDTVVGDVRSSTSFRRPTGSRICASTSIERSIDAIDSRRVISSSSLTFAPSGTPSETKTRCERKIGRAHVCTPVTNAHIVCRLLLEKKKKTKTQQQQIIDLIYDS